MTAAKKREASRGAESWARLSADNAAYPPWLALYLRLQAELNTLASVSIEVPALRPAFKRLREALGD